MSALVKSALGGICVMAMAVSAYWYIPEARFLGVKSAEVSLCFAESDGRVRYFDPWLGKVVLAPHRMACLDGRRLSNRADNVTLARVAPIEAEVLPVIE